MRYKRIQIHDELIKYEEKMCLSRPQDSSVIWHVEVTDGKIFIVSILRGS